MGFDPYSWEGFWISASHPALFLVFYLVPGWAFFVLVVGLDLLVGRWLRRGGRK